MPTDALFHVELLICTFQLYIDSEYIRMAVPCATGNGRQRSVKPACDAHDYTADSGRPRSRRNEPGTDPGKPETLSQNGRSCYMNLCVQLASFFGVREYEYDFACS